MVLNPCLTAFSSFQCLFHSCPKQVRRETSRRGDVFQETLLNKSLRGVEAKMSQLPCPAGETFPGCVFCFTGLPDRKKPSCPQWGMTLSSPPCGWLLSRSLLLCWCLLVLFAPISLLQICLQGYSTPRLLTSSPHGAERSDSSGCDSLRDMSLAWSEVHIREVVPTHCLGFSFWCKVRTWPDWREVTHPWESSSDLDHLASTCLWPAETRSALIVFPPSQFHCGPSTARSLSDTQIFTHKQLYRVWGHHENWW